MLFFSWLPNRMTNPRTKRSALRSRPARYRRVLEVLEDRALLAGLNVTTPFDVVDPHDGVLSLREAVLQANAEPGLDTINVPAGIIRVQHGELAITGDVSIQGAGAGDPGLTTTTFRQFGFSRVFHVYSGATVTISAASIDFGGAVQGGGIYNEGGNLTLADCWLRENQAEQGGAVYNAGGNLVVTGSSLMFNSAYAGTGRGFEEAVQPGMGGAIYNAGGSVFISGSTIDGNFAWGSDRYPSSSTDTTGIGGPGGDGINGMGGGIYNADGSLVISASSLSFNRAEGGTGGKGTDMSNFVGGPYGFYLFTGIGGQGGAGGDGMGGAIYHANGSLLIADSSITENQARGGIGGSGGDGIIGGDSGLSGAGLGGGLFLAGGAGTVTGSTLSGNLAVGATSEGNFALGAPRPGAGSDGGLGAGGGLYLLAGTLQIDSSTIADNHARGGDGGNGGNSFYTSGHTILDFQGPGGAGGDGLGGGAYVAGGTLTVTDSSFTDNEATSGLRSDRNPSGPDGNGIGGALYIAVGSLCLDQDTLDAFFGNLASTSYDDVFGPFVVT